MKRATDSYCESDAISGSFVGSGSEREGTGNSCSPETCSGVRLVTSSFSCGAAVSRSASSGAASTSCSTLSSSSSTCLSARNSFRLFAIGVALVSLTPDRLRDRRQYLLGIGDRFERDEVDALLEVLEELRCGLEAEPGLARSAGTGERQQTHLRSGQKIDRPPPPRAPGRSTVSVEQEGCGPVFERPQCRELVRQPGDHELREPLRPGQVLEPVLAEVAERDIVGSSSSTNSRVVAESSVWPP